MNRNGQLLFLRRAARSDLLRAMVHPQLGCVLSAQWGALIAGLSILVASAHAVTEKSDEGVDFTRDIRPILSNRCFACHGPDDEGREAGLRLDSFEGATKVGESGLAAIVASEPDNSELLRRIASDDDGERMPPGDTGAPLSTREVALLRRWIEQGAEYTQHWAFRPIQNCELPPPVADGRSEPAANPIDRFIDAKLTQHDVTPVPLARRQTLIRRLYLDLLGLLPDWSEVESFLDDESTNAYERLVDRLLANPHYGERWGRHWLDQARYADTNGYTIDSPRTMWPYRDWVIRAINADMPFNRFTRDQIAGDLLENPTDDQLIATGFHRNTLINQEGGTDKEQFRNEAVVDRVNTTGAVWLGLTIGCSQCHNHKFDPITQAEYYRLFDFFNQQQDINSVEPFVRVAEPRQREKLDQLERVLATAQTRLDRFLAEVAAALPPDERDDGQPIAWSVVAADLFRADSESEHATLEDNSLLVEGEHRSSDRYALTFHTSLPRITAVRIECITHPKLPLGGPGRSAEGIVRFGRGRATRREARRSMDSRLGRLFPARIRNRQCDRR